MAQPFNPIRSTTQDFTEIEDITQDVVLLRDGACALIIRTTAVNFDLLSQNEQEAMILAYAGFLNSLSFPIQVLIHSEKKDVTAYLNLLNKQQSEQKNPVLAARIASYREFVATTVKERNVLDKKFYIVIPFSALELGVANVKSFVKRTTLPYSKNYILDRARNILFPKRDHVLRQLGRFGLQGEHLNTKGLIELFYNIYHAGAVHNIAKEVEYQTPIL